MKIFAVIGDPIMHSKSPRMHNNALQVLKEGAVYTRYHLKDKTKLKEIVQKLDGANITIPFKEVACEIADFKDESVMHIGSANTLLNKDNKIYAYNTDYLGFLKVIEDFSFIKNALILGAGGTAKALAYALKSRSVEVTIANRSSARFESLANYPCFLYAQLDLSKKFDLIINTTSAGLNDAKLPCQEEILKNIFQHAKYAFDVIYGKNTPFLKLARENGLKIKDGTQMLLWQGVFAFELFLECQKTEEIFKAMRMALKLP
ncbi:shikimate dehydrogenase [Campylobacter subantarcticus LMG 24377]|uniref:Shikimate dehydrogenase (NADP(+)) n=2 Tax=Campylobacter subantarcticus TaxID=497724 RepID=A0A0A8H8E6_9BACT|nr:shikimate dehydrogenase [Campylobacter subantarcticus]EAJ1261620.1 shikimate dehydrogenase [Campylobacter lari]AJC90398.1 shikimate dehydrogenase [Campylobacter subantarcticus LMG 24374]AJC92060.1 shikimate dehydrogenase [Campylobacter subantarcticus LMG 24377]EAL3939647.1 shikimate dehydrogenase [Campylobacter lari]MPB99324.1 shikimate dehydrogenase [Campylobacter subantarcticus]